VVRELAEEVGIHISTHTPRRSPSPSLASNPGAAYPELIPTKVELTG
jgi:hypothetical protein